MKTVTLALGDDGKVYVDGTETHASTLMAMFGPAGRQLPSFEYRRAELTREFEQDQIDVLRVLAENMETWPIM